MRAATRIVSQGRNTQNCPAHFSSIIHFITCLISRAAQPYGLCERPSEPQGHKAKALGEAHPNLKTSEVTFDPTQGPALLYMVGLA